MLVEIPAFCGLNPHERLQGHFVHVPGGINVLGCAHLWVLEEITFHSQFARTPMSRIWQIGMIQKFHWLPQLIVVIHHFISWADKAKWISPHSPREQATRFLLVSSATQMKFDPLEWTGSLLTDPLILALLQPLHREQISPSLLAWGIALPGQDLESCFLGTNTFLLSICDLRGSKACSWEYIC